MRNTLLTFLAAALTVICLAFPQMARGDDWLVDFEKAKKLAAKNKLDILMEFTGSDWCPPCKRLKASVFSKDLFKETAPKHFVLLKLDFPRDKSKQSKEEIAQNKKLNTQYGISGYPTIILADAAGRPYAKKVGYGGQAAQAYVDGLIKNTSVRKNRDKFLAEAMSVKGLDRAKLLAKAVKGIDAELVLSGYRKTVDEIIKLDPDNKAKLKQRFADLVQLVDIKKSLKKIQQSGLRDANAAIKSVESLIAANKLSGAPLQEALFTKGALLFRSDKTASRKALESAVDANPDSARGRQIRTIIKRSFKN